MEKKRFKKSDGIKLQGFARMQIKDYDENGVPSKVVSDTGWLGPNMKTRIGLLYFIAYAIGSSTGYSSITYAQVGTGGSPASTDASLAGEATNVRAPTTLSFIGSQTVQWIASWGSASNANSFTVGNVGLYGHSSALSLAWGISTPGQTWATNQSCAITYQLTLA